MDDSIEVLAEGRFLRLLKEGRWEYVRRVNARGAAFIVARTDADELVLVEQYRVPLHARTIELPAGIIGDEAEHRDESIEASALRELEEETGFRGARAELLLSGPTAPGMSGEQGHFVRAYALTRVGPGGGVGNEDITVHVVPIAAIDAWLVTQQQAGLQVDARVFAGLYLLRQAGA
jgi:ADP-ribose pyrophosphatase